MKVCSKCFSEKPITSYWKANTCKDGRRNKCKDCYSTEKKTYREENKSWLLQSKKDFYHKNKIRINLKRKEEYDPEKSKNYKDVYYSKLENKEKIKIAGFIYREENKNTLKYKAAKAYCSALRRISKKQRTPLWLDSIQKKEIKKLYLKAKEMEARDKIKYHVDHIVPLNGKNVSGLHVLWNLQILTEKENLSKGNRYERTT